MQSLETLYSGLLGIIKQISDSILFLWTIANIEFSKLIADPFGQLSLAYHRILTEISKLIGITTSGITEAFQGFISDPLYLVFTSLALLPVILWQIFLFKKSKNRKIQIIIFLMGTLTVIPIFAVMRLFEYYPQFDFISQANEAINNPIYQFLITFAWVGLSEELVKQWILRYLDSKYLLVQTINDSINLSLISALGFSFAENILYFHNIAAGFGLGSLIIAFLFRSIFTTCSHLVCSGFFGYYYGIAKFSMSIVEESNWEGKKLRIARTIGRIFNISRIQAYQETTILKGLLIALALHAAYDFLFQMNAYTGNPLFIIAGAVFIITFYLLLKKILKNRAGRLILSDEQTKQKVSSMAKTDEDVVIELLGMWFNKGNYVDVIHICGRLLKRDPDNRVVKLFKAKALDQMTHDNPYKLILSKLFPDHKTS